MPTPFYFQYGSPLGAVTSCILVSDDHRTILAKGIAIWDRINPFNETEGCTIARKRADRALRRDPECLLMSCLPEAVAHIREAGYYESGFQEFPEYCASVNFERDSTPEISSFLTQKEIDFLNELHIPGEQNEDKA